MDKLVIEATKSSPRVEGDTAGHKLTINGQSYPENAFKFYEPVLDWAEGFLQEAAAPVIVELMLPYINTSSTKCLLMLLEKFDAAYESGKTVEVRWYYNRDNESELECAEEFKEDLRLPFHIVPKEA
jgi:hypothetical protein